MAAGRVCRNLAVSRALGDFEFKDRPTLSAKEQKVTVDPDMTIIERTVGVQYPPGPPSSLPIWTDAFLVTLSPIPSVVRLLLASWHPAWTEMTLDV